MTEQQYMLAMLTASKNQAAALEEIGRQLMILNQSRPAKSLFENVFGPAK